MQKILHEKVTYSIDVLFVSEFLCLQEYVSLRRR